jgi:hypothetical protein
VQRERRELLEGEERVERRTDEVGWGGVGWGLGKRRLLLRDPAGDAEPRRLRAGRGICSAHTHARHGHAPCRRRRAGVLGSSRVCVVVVGAVR